MHSFFDHLLLLLLNLYLFFAAAQYPPSPSNLTTIVSPVDGNITITFKSPRAGTCQTAFDTQQQYTGWVNIPGTYPTNTFFWFIAGREATSQLTVWLNGGPGSSSMLGLFAENGPCEAIEIAAGQFGTKVREWGWDRASNMLYIDQPNQVGLSYDVPTNCSYDLMTSNLYTPQQVLPNSQPADTFLNGTFSSLNQNNTANTTEIAAMAVWHVVQAFLGSFPQYNPGNQTGNIIGINLFTESYGGKYGPAFASFWDQQNKKRLNGSLSQGGSIAVKLVSLGIMNGCIDDLIQAPYYPAMAVNNTFGITTINPTRANLAAASFSASGGCSDNIKTCREALVSQDPHDTGDISVINSLCSNAYQFCAGNVMDPYSDAGRSYYDIAHFLPDSFPPSTYIEYLNTESFQAAIGSPINYTQTDYQVAKAFASTGDYERDSFVPAIASLLNQGVRVGLIYGDRDYICNWMGGQAISFAVAAAASPAYMNKYNAAGYAPIIVNDSYIGGVVRQYGNLSFSRIYDSGHMVPAYQPETAFQVFARIISGNSISTGEVIDLSQYNSTGPANATHTNSLPSSPSATCWIRNVPNTCNDEQKNMILNDEGVIINGVLYNSAEDWSTSFGLAASSSSSMGPTGTYTTIAEVLTGAYTATATPSPNTAPLRRLPSDELFLVAGVAAVIIYTY